MKGTQLLHFRLNLFKPAHNSHQRTLMQPRGQRVQLLRRAHRISFHAAVVQVSNPASHTQSACFVLNKVAVANTLHSA